MTDVSVTLDEIEIDNTANGVVMRNVKGSATFNGGQIEDTTANGMLFDNSFIRDLKVQRTCSLPMGSLPGSTVCGSRITTLVLV